MRTAPARTSYGPKRTSRPSKQRSLRTTAGPHPPLQLRPWSACTSFSPVLPQPDTAPACCLNNRSAGPETDQV